MPHQTGSTSSVTAQPAACLNGLKHGSSARKLFLPDEDPADFFALLHEAFQLYQPTTERDAVFVADLARARWFLVRRERAYSFREFNLRLQKPDASLWTAGDHNEVRLLKRYRTEAQRAVRRARNNLQHYSKDALRRRRWQDLLDLFKERLAKEA